MASALTESLVLSAIRVSQRPVHHPVGGWHSRKRRKHPRGKPHQGHFRTAADPAFTYLFYRNLSPAHGSTLKKLGRAARLLRG